MNQTSHPESQPRVRMTKQLSESRKPAVALVAAMTFLSWSGAYIHTTLELALPVWRPENSVPALLGFLLLLGWWKQPQQRRMWAWLFLVWTVGGHLLLGAILSALPLPLWPFYPEQSVAHYLSHVIYGAAQLPLIWVMVRHLR
jgi:hypothetical protein